MFKDIEISSFFEVKKTGKTQAKVFKDLNVGDIIKISVRLDEKADRAESQRIPLFLNNQRIYISTLNTVIKHGLVLKEVKRKGELGYKGVIIQEANNQSLKEELMEQRGIALMEKLENDFIKSQLRNIRTRLLRDNFLDYAGEIQQIINCRRMIEDEFNEEQYKVD